MRRAIWMCLSSSLVGALMMYLFDRDAGRRRRHLLRDRLIARLRRIERQVGHRLRGAAAPTYAVAHRIAHLVAQTTDAPLVGHLT